MRNMRLPSCVVALTLLALSCLNEDIVRPPDCDGTLDVTEVVIVNPTTCTEKGTITLSVTGGKPPYQFSRNGLDLQTSNTFSNLTSGNHFITVFDVIGCVKDTMVVVDLPPTTDIGITIVSVTADDDCFSDNGAIKLGWTGTTDNAPVLYSFNGSEFTSTLEYSSLPPGNYDAIVKDKNGCTDTEFATVPRESTNTSWINQVKGIMISKCVGCHPGNGSPDNWSVYEDVFAKRSSVKSKVASGTMPPKSSVQLTETERALIICWIDDGAPKN